MLNKKFILLVLLLVSLLSISAVSAVDDTASDNSIQDGSIDDIGALQSSDEELNLDENDDGDVLAKANDDAEISESPGTFTDLNAAINDNSNPTVNLARNYTYVDSDSSFQHGVVINRSVTVNGNGYTLDGSENARIFHISSDATVVFKNITFIDGYEEDNGAAILAENTTKVTAIDCKFIDCKTRNGHGGAMAISGRAYDDNFDYNKIISAVNCIFTDNSALYGGAMYFGSAVNCNFIDNDALYGGAISDVSARDCNFINNSATLGGGAIIGGSAVNCIFTGNTAGDDEGSGVGSGSGGAIYYGSAVNCTFTNNSATYSGGAIYEGSAIDCTFIGNNASMDKDVFNVNLTFNTKITAPKVTAIYNVNKYLVVTLKDSKGNVLANKKVTVKVGTISKTLTTNNKGQVSVLVSKLVPKTYTAKFSFAGNGNYLKSSSSVKVVVKKATPKLTAKAKTFKRKVKTKKYKITLKTNKGKVMKKVKVTLRVNKKTFTAKTNSKGVATFKITNLKKKGKYTAIVKYAGSKYYKKVTKKSKITVKK